MRKYWKVYLNSIQDALADRARILVYVLEDLIPPSVSILLWIGIYQWSASTSSGWELQKLISYYLLVTFFSLALNHHLEFAIGERDIQRGGLVKYLTRPVSYITFTLAGSTGWKSVRLFMSLFPFALLFFLFRQYWNASVSPVTVLLAFGFATIAYMMIFFYRFLLGISAFWVTENYGVVNFFWMIQALFSGLLVPFDFLPTWLKDVSLFLPFRFFYYVPSIVLLNDHSRRNLWSDLCIALVWLTILVLFTRYLFNRGLKQFTDTRQ